jgi:hypothetical protein
VSETKRKLGKDGGTLTILVGDTIQATTMKNENNNNTDDILNNNNTNTLRRHRLVSTSTSSSTEPTNRTTSASLGNNDIMSSSNLSSSSSSSSLSYAQHQPIRRFQEKAPRSILSLSWQRWIVRYLTLTRASQVIMVSMVICLALLLPPTIYLMSSSSQTTIWTMDQSYNGMSIPTEIQSHHRIRRNIKSDAKNNKKKISYPQVNDIFMKNYDEEQQPPPSLSLKLKLKFDRNNTSFERFFHRTTFPSPREPRVVKLTDQNHSFHLSIAPGSAAVNDEELFDIKQWGLRELKQSYVEIRMKNPKSLHQAESLDKGDCQPIAPSWQLSHNPTCNTIHEESSGWQQLYQLPINKHNLIDPDRDQNEQMRLVNKGAFRHVWMIRDHDGVTKRAMKTLRSLRTKEKKFDLRNQDRHRRDAIAFDELHKSSLVVDIYGHCSNTAIFDYADGGDLTRIYDEDSPEPTKLDVLRIAYNVSLSIHDAHHIDEEGRPTMAHTDIKTDQFIYQDGYYKLSDFNRVRFLMWNQTFHKWNQTSDGQCGFNVAKNGGEYRSPEEYAYEKETEKVDVYSLGNVLYFLLVGIEPWKGVNLKDVYKFVIAKQRPKIPDEIYNNPGVYERCMIRAMENAWIHNKDDRPSALQVANIIKEGINILEKHD